MGVWDKKLSGFALETALAVEVFGCKRASANDEKSTTWEGVGEVVERMRALGWRVALALDLAEDGGTFLAEFRKDSLRIAASQESCEAPIAIARAAIMAVQWEREHSRVPK